MATAQTIYNKAISLIDEIDSVTKLPNTDNTEDYSANALFQLNLLQMELMPYSETYKKYELSCKPYTNLVRDQFSVGKHYSDDVSVEATAGANAYYFECDGSGTAIVEDFNGTWNTLATIVLTEPVSGFTAYKGTITPTSGATESRIRFTGSSYYVFQNCALFAEIFTSSSRIPNYRKYIKATLPTDLYFIQEVLVEQAIGTYENESAYKIEETGNTRELFYRYDFDGVLKVIYRAYPTELSAMTDTIECDRMTETLLSYALAMYFATEDNNENLYNILKMRYNELKQISSLPKVQPMQKIVNVYGGF